MTDTVFNPLDHQITWNGINLMEDVTLATFATSTRVQQELASQEFSLQGRQLAIAGTIYGGSFTINYRQHSPLIRELIAIAVADRGRAPGDRIVSTLEFIDRSIQMRKPYTRARLASIPESNASNGVVDMSFVWFFQSMTPEALSDG